MASVIRVVLQDEVEHLGGSGDVVKVRPGYARNYLVPRGLAAPATEANLARVDSLKRQAATREEQRRNQAEALAKQIEVTPVRIERAVGEENKMFGSVTSRDIEDAYRAKGVEIDHRRIDLKEPIKSLGLAEVTIRLYGDVGATLRVEVVKQS